MMKNLRIIAPAILSLLTIAIAPKANAVPEIQSIPEGIEVTTGSCYVQFNHSGEMIYVADRCNDSQVREAQRAAESYMNEQDGSGSEHRNGGNHNNNGGYNNNGVDYSHPFNGESDFAQVTNVPANNLPIFEQPKGGSRQVATNIANGTVLRSFGCEEHNGATWCEVELRNRPTWRGWVRNMFLKPY